jgi:hypothetical protein
VKRDSVKLQLPAGMKATHALSVTRELLRCLNPGADAAIKRRGAARLRNWAALRKLWWNDVILGYALAEKESAGRPVNEVALRFFVTKKFPRTKLSLAERIPEYVQLENKDGECMKLVTDVVEIGRAPSLQRDVSSGEALGHFLGTNGTLGVNVEFGAGTAALTCAHVVAPVMAHALGDAVESPPDGDRKAGPNVMGRLVAAAPLSLTSANTVDAALVTPGTGVTLTNQRLGLGPSPAFMNLTLAQFAQMRQRVIRVESQRGSLAGQLDSVHGSMKFDFGNRRLTFTNIFSYRLVSKTAGGDSGSAVVDATTRGILGLHFAGLEQMGFGIPAQSILQALPGIGKVI